MKHLPFAPDLDFDFPVMLLHDGADLPDQENHHLPPDVVAGGMGKDFLHRVQILAVEALGLGGSIYPLVRFDLK
jgi:hypothetical protein